MGVTLEKFKLLSKITEPDSRNQHYVVTNTKTGESRPMTIEDVYQSVKSISLSESVPDSIKSQFNVAKNLAVYSWFSYSFHQIAEMKAYSVVEAALKMKLGTHKNGFRGLIKKAVNTGLIKDSGFQHIKSDEESVQYSSQLPGLMSGFRNNLAHGSTKLYPGSVTDLRICADFINQLFNKA